MSRTAAALFLLLLAACARPARREATSLADAVDRYRRAEGPAKADRAREVANLACTDARVCDVKRTCVGAIDTTVQALSIKDEVAARIADIEKGALERDDPAARALPGKLQEAQRLLAQGREAMRDCDAKLARLRADYGP